MIFVYPITTPANTPATNKQKTVMKVSAGVIHRLRIFFPPGPMGLAHIQINRGLNQLFPTNPEADFAEDASLIDMQEYISLEYEPLELEAYTWNEDDTHSHTITVTIGILPREVLTLERQIRSLKEDILQLYRLTTRL